MDLMTAEQAGHFLQSQANHQSSSLANGDMPHAQHAQATHNGHQVAAGLAQVHQLLASRISNGVLHEAHHNFLSRGNLITKLGCTCKRPAMTCSLCMIAEHHIENDSKQPLLWLSSMCLLA